MANFRTHYDNLKVARNAPDSIIKAAYKGLCQTYHPDKYQGSNKEAERIFKIVKASYVVLIDPVQRASHDYWIKNQEAKATGQESYQRKDRRAAPKTDEPPPSENTNQQANFTETEEVNDRWQDKSQDSQKKQRQQPESKQSKESRPTYSWRRYFARNFIDYSISGSLLGFIFAFWQGMGHQLPDWITATSPLKIIGWSFFSTLLWVCLEPIILSIFGTTPGKALFRLQLVSDNNQPDYWGRSFAVWAVGMGFCIPLVSLFTMLNADTRLKKNGKTDWDRWMEFSVTAEPLTILRKALIVVVSTLLLAVLIMASNIVWSLVNKVETTQEQAQQEDTQQAIPQSITNAEDMFQRANNFYTQGKYAEALPLYQNLAEQGYSGAQISLGKMNESGNGVIKDFNQATFWYRKATEAGDENKEIANTALNKLINKLQAQASLDEKSQARLNAQAKAKALLEEKAQAQAYVEKQAQALLDAQVQALDARVQAQARLDTQTKALALAKAAADKLGVTLPDGGIIFYVDNSGSHGLAAKASDESNRLNWDDATDTDYGSGWRLPTNDELQLLYDQKTVVGGFTAGNYWSSTKSANRTAWCQDFSNSRTYYYPIDYEINVRAIRQF
jgi:hypothetical protein